MKRAGELIGDVILVKSSVHRDRRGHFLEVFRVDKLAACGITATFVQDNVSHSVQGTLRGLHFQNPHPQGKLVMPLSGRIYDVVVDVRRSSVNFAKWAGIELDSESGLALWIPPGFAHGFQVLSAEAVVLYKATDYWYPAGEHTIRWDDPVLRIGWPLPDPIVSDKDAAGHVLGDLTSLPNA